MPNSLKMFFAWVSSYKRRISTKKEDELPSDSPDIFFPFFGPTPWGCRNKSFVAEGITYSFRDVAQEDGNLAGMTLLQDSNSATWMLFDFHCCIAVWNNGLGLAWRESGNGIEKRIVFDCFELSRLTKIIDPLGIAKEVRQRKLGIALLPTEQSWEISPYLEAGLHSINSPLGWSSFGETLVLANHANTDNPNKMTCAIFAFDWKKRQVQVLPQDWFNQGNYDFDYQWITRVARRNDGSIVGDGIRLGIFELDSTNRQVSKWLESNPFYMI